MLLLNVLTQNNVSLRLKNRVLTRFFVLMTSNSTAFALKGMILRKENPTAYEFIYQSNVKTRLGSLVNDEKNLTSLR